MEFAASVSAKSVPVFARNCRAIGRRPCPRDGPVPARTTADRHRQVSAQHHDPVSMRHGTRRVILRSRTRWQLRDTAACCGIMFAPTAHRVRPGDGALRARPFRVHPGHRAVAQRGEWSNGYGVFPVHTVFECRLPSGQITRRSVPRDTGDASTRHMTLLRMFRTLDAGWPTGHCARRAIPEIPLLRRMPRMPGRRCDQRSAGRRSRYPLRVRPQRFAAIVCADQAKP